MTEEPQGGVGERPEAETSQLPAQGGDIGERPDAETSLLPPQGGFGEPPEPETSPLPPQGWAGPYLQSPEVPPFQVPPIEMGQPVVPVGLAVPAPPADWWRAAAAGLLTLSGLGLGFALLRRWWAAVVCWLATGLLVLIAFPATAGGVSATVVVLYLIFLVLAAVRAVARGLRTHLTWPQSSRAAIAFAVVSLVVPIGGAALYDSAHQEAVQKMLLSRLAQADQTVATAQTQSIDAAEPLYSTALATYGDLLDHHRRSRAGKLVPDRLAAFYQAVGAPFTNGDYCGAIEPLTFLRSLPSAAISAGDLGTLATWPDDRLATSLYQCGVKALGPNGDTTAATDLNQLLSTFPASAQSGKVASAVGDAIKTAAAGITGSDPCTATAGLTKLGTQISPLTSTQASVTAGLKKDTDAVNGDIESGTYACAVSDYTGGKFTDAETAMNNFVTTYPDDPHKALAQKYSIAAQVAQQDADAGKVVPTLTSGGSVSVTIYNDSPDPVVMLYTGPATGSVNIAACSSCKIYASDTDGQQNACSAGLDYPKTTFTLPPGTTYFLQQSSGLGVTSSVHTEQYDADSSYQACAYETNAFGL